MQQLLKLCGQEVRCSACMVLAILFHKDWPTMFMFQALLV